MRQRLVHRGPDDHGVWQANNVALAHQRLSIVDLSAAGHQPMLSNSGRWVVSYNGEIYNAAELRRDFVGHVWRGKSDTEVLTESIALHGVEQTVTRLAGMFAFAAFDTHTSKLWLARDRLGVKPLYYGLHGNEFLFASELHAISAVAPELELNRDAISSFLRYSYVPNPSSIYSSIHKLPPGHLLMLDTNNPSVTEVTSRAYWSLKHYVDVDPILDEASAQNQLHELLRESVKARLIADVPLGAFLSGGYDSTLVCALMQEMSTEPTKTFTIGFVDKRFNEANHASRIAEHLGTNHTELYVSEADLLRSVEKLGSLNDEPFADASILPTYLVSELAARHVKVALSGDGGDELFWGYNRYASSVRIWRMMQYAPTFLRQAGAHVFRSRWVQKITAGIPAPAWGGRAGPLNQKLNAASEVLGSDDQFDLYHAMMSHWKNPTDVLLGGQDLSTAYNDRSHWTADLPALPRMALQDTMTYLPDDILTKVDRASMAVSLEARVPLLDHRVVEFTSQLHPHLKVRNQKTKYLLRQILYDYVPATLLDRPKVGFGVPLDHWLRGPLKDWTCDLLSEQRLVRQGLLRPAPIGALLKQHLSGEANNGAKLWNVLMLQAWLDTTGRG